MSRRFRPDPNDRPPAEPAPAGPPEECPACGEVAERRWTTRRVPNPDGGRGSVMGRVQVCTACDTIIAPDA